MTTGTANSIDLAADANLLELWRRDVPFPTVELMQDVDVVTHVCVDKAIAPDGSVKYRYLHDSRLASHTGSLYLCWANHLDGEVHHTDAMIRGCRSDDGGLTWSEPRTWAAAPMCSSECFNHSVLASHQGKLWGFFTAWNDKQPRVEICTLNESTDQWEPCRAQIPGMLPFRQPMKMADDNWIIGGEETFYLPAVAISEGDDFTKWKLIRIPFPADMKMEFPETTLIDQGNRLLAVCRPKNTPTALVSVSIDMGRTWSELRPSNFPIASSEPFAGRLSTGQHYLITNNLEEGRALLSIAVTEPGERCFSRMWKIRHQQFPRRRAFTGVFWRGKLHLPKLGHTTEWSYPSAVERDDHLIISYSQGKEACCVSIIPIRVLAVV